MNGVTLRGLSRKQAADIIQGEKVGADGLFIRERWIHSVVLFLLAGKAHSML